MSLTTVLHDDSTQVLAWVAALESRSEHPLAKALTAYAEEQGARPDALASFDSVTGGGVKGTSQANDTLLLGNARLLEASGVDLSPADESIRQLEAKARSLVYLAVNGKLAALFGVGDPLRKDAAAAVKRLQDDGLTVVMLTGDNEHTAAAVARE